MDRGLEITLNRLRGGKIDDSWWRQFLDRMGQKYVAPEFLEKPATQEWLAQAHVADDLKALARAVLMRGDGSDPEIRERLAGTYSDLTGEDPSFARAPIDVAVGILVAGYVASIPPDQRLVAGMIQDQSVGLHERFDRLERHALTDPITRKAHTEQAEQELNRILLLRVVDPIRARRNSQDLFKRTSAGDLAAINDPTRNKVRYWAARLCATDTETLDFARQLREEAGRRDSGVDFSVVDALLAESDGNVDGALRLLRDNHDPDSRTEFFRLQTRTKGERKALDWYADHAESGDSGFFTAVGWRSWAVCMMKAGRWEEAAARLRGLESQWPDMPALAIVEGVANAALLLPDERRETAFPGPPLYGGIVPGLGNDAEDLHSRAVAAFDFAERRLAEVTDDELGRLIREWRLWLRLMDPEPENAANARDDVRQRIGRGAGAAGLVPFAYAFDIDYDGRPLRAHLENRRRLGGLNDRELGAECLLAQQSMSPRDLVNYLEKHGEHLAKVMPAPFMTAIHVDALLRDDQPERARALVKEREMDLGEAYSKLLMAEIDTHEGHDPRQQLENLYSQTRSLESLLLLIAHLKEVDDRQALLPLVRELFERERTVENAHDIVRCLSGPPSVDRGSIIAFLEANPDVLEGSDDLKATMASALYHASRFADSRALNDLLLSRRDDDRDLHLDIDIAVSSGDWERLLTIVDREWRRRDEHRAETLVKLAQIAGQQDRIPDRALQLVRLAASKEPRDPRVLMSAYLLHVRFGRDDDAEGAWLVQASELSSADEGPVWRVNPRDVVTEWIPRRHEHLRGVHQKLLNGEIPIGLAAGAWNLPLASLLLAVPDQNGNESDGRCRAMLPVVAGSREPMDLKEDWTIGLDVTSVMVLYHLGLLETVLEAFRHTKLAPETMECLFRERDEARFHQPSRIEAAKHLRVFQTRGSLQHASDLAEPPDDLATEVGPELAALLHTARKKNGRVICGFPIYQVGSLMEKPAETSRYDDLIHSTMDLCILLHESGRMDSSDFQRARSFLSIQGQTECSSDSLGILDGTIFVDRLALDYLQRAGVLRPIAAAGLDLLVHPDVLDDINALIEEGDTGEELANRIDRIRHTLRNAVDSGTVSFLPRNLGQGEQPERIEYRFQATASLVTGSAACDAICVDDRYINGTAALALSGDASIPIVCVLDVLRYLVSRGYMDVAEHWTTRHRLRQGGFAFIPLESDELLHWLKGASFDKNQWTESVELRVLRQAVARTASLDSIKLSEASALTKNVTVVCREAVADLWENTREDTRLTTEQAAALSDWVWRSLATLATPARGHLPVEEYKEWIGNTLSWRLARLFLPMTIQSQDRRAGYARWLDQSVLQGLQQANPSTIETALSFVRETISSLPGDQEMYGHLFFDQLPDSARRVAINGDVEFARRCGFERRRVLEIGPGCRLAGSELFATVKTVFAERKKGSLRNTAGNDVSVDIDTDERNIVLQWSDAEPASPRVQIPVLALLSPDGETRLAALRDVIDRLGPTATDFSPLRESIESRELRDEELGSVLDETFHGVAALQSRLAGRIKDGLNFAAADVVPPSVSYFERFAGPRPVSGEPEAYLDEVLVPYRKGLLHRDLRAGLDICCLGALRDDLMPARWIDAVDDDAVWDALAACDAGSNPFSLLAALDVALYRQGDPRFRDLAADAVARLCDENLGMADGPDIYGLLPVLAGLVLNWLPLLEGGARYPGYWKRMSAWMQAGLMARLLMTSSSLIDIDKLREWTHASMARGGFYAGLLDARTEPMLSAGWITRRGLRSEVVGRLQILRVRHEGTGRQVPRSQEIDRVLAPSDDPERTLVLGFPGPLEGHKHPTGLLPQELVEDIEKAWAGGSNLSVLPQLATVSQLAALDEPLLDRVRDVARMIGQNPGGADRRESLTSLEYLSVVAAATRDAMLADRIAAALIGMAPGAADDQEIAKIFQITLQAAAAVEAHDAWFEWLEERLAAVATHLPPPPSESLNVFLGHLDQIELILPAESWFHIKARSIALAGAR